MEQKIFGGRYKVHSKLGEGGMAFVYVALDTKLDRQVAIKVLHKHMLKNLDIRERFETEARAVSQLEHPNIVKIYDYSGQDSEELWIVMELIDGWNLAQFIEQFPGRFLHPIISTCMIREICKALAKAHSTGLVHRDIKPENIMVMHDGHIKLMDFGIVKKLSKSSLTQVGTFMGSPSYMSPEQIRGRNVDHRSDIYSLCIMYYEIVTGHLPFTGTSTQDVVLKIIEGSFSPPRHLMPSLPATIDAIIVAGIQKSPGNRYQNITEISGRIDQFLKSHGLVESHVELERFFLDRNRYLQRLAMSDYGDGTPAVAKTVPQKKHQYNSSSQGAINATRMKNELIPLDRGFRTDSDAQQLAAATLKISATRQIEEETQATQASQKSLDDEPKTLEQSHVPVKGLKPATQQYPGASMPLAANGKPPSDQARTAKKRSHRKKSRVLKEQLPRSPSEQARPSDWFSQIAGIVLIGAIITISLLGFWQIRQKLDSNEGLSISHGHLSSPLPKSNTKESNTFKSSEVSKTTEERHQAAPPLRIEQNISNIEPTNDNKSPAISPQDPKIPATRPKKIRPFDNSDYHEIKVPELRIPVGRAAGFNDGFAAHPVAQEKKVAAVNQERTSVPDYPKSTLSPVIKIVSRPASQVFIDGKKVGTTNDDTVNSGWIKLIPGRRLLELKRDNYISYRRVIDAKNGDRLELPQIQLKESELVTLTIKTRQSGCRIEITDSATNASLASFTMSTGSKSVALRPGSYHIKVQFETTVKERIIQVTSAEGPIVFDVGEMM